MVVLQASGLSKRNHNSLCICDPCRKQNKDTFQKVAELKNSGLHIYRYNPDETNKLFKMDKSTCQRDEKQYVVLENTARKTLQRYEFINELCQYRTKCIRCKMTVSNIQNLLDKICTIKQNEIIGVCEYCKRHNVRGNCKRCEAVVGKFLKNRLISERMQAECVEKLAINVLEFLKYIFDHCGVCNHVKDKCILETSELQKLCEHLPHFTERSRYIEIKDFPGPYIKEENSSFEATKKNLKDHLDILQHKIKNLEEKLSFNEVNDTTLYGKETEGNRKSSDLMVKKTLDSISMIMNRVAKNQDFNKNTPATSETQLARQIQKYFPLVQLQNDKPLQNINISSKLNNKAQVYHDRDRGRDYDKAATLQSKDRKSMRTKDNLTKPRAKRTSPRIPEIDLNSKLNKKTQHKGHDKTTTLQTKDIKSIPIKQNLTKARAKSTTPRVHEIKQSKSKNKSGYKIALPTDKRYVRSYYDIPDKHLQTKHSKFKKNTRDKEHHFFGKTSTLRTKYLKLVSKKLSKDLNKGRAKSATPQLHQSEELISKKKNVNKNEIPKDKQFYNKNYFSTRVVQLLNDEALKSVNISSKLKKKTRQHDKTATMGTKETDDHYSTSDSMVQLRNDGTLPTIHIKSKSKKRTFDKEPDKTTKMQTKDSQSISTKENLTKGRAKSAIPQTRTSEELKSKTKNLLDRRPIARYNDDHFSTSISMVQLRNDGILPSIHINSKLKKKSVDKEHDKKVTGQTKDLQSISTKEKLTKGREHSPKSRIDRSEEPKLKRKNEYKFKIPIDKRLTASLKDKYFTRSTKDNQESIIQHQNKADMLKKMSMTEMVKSYKFDLETFDSNDLRDIVVCEGSETECSKIILGNEIVPLRAVDEDILNVKSSISDKPTSLTPIVQESIKPFKRRKSTRTLLKTEPEQSLERKWNFTYQLSNPYYIATGWTKLPKENIRKEVISYKMKPTDAKTNWFVRNQNQNIILSDNGTKFAEFDMNGNCKIYYKNGKIALEYFHSDGTNEGCRFKIYSDGENEYPSRKFKPVMVLAIFDYSGNGIVYDDDGSIRLKYNQRQGFLVDKKIGVPRRWQWQWRGYGFVRSKLKKDNSELHGSGDSDLNVSSVEYSYNVKEFKKKPHFKPKCIPYDIKVGPFKINDHFKLFIVDQSRIYLSFTETKVPIKVNVGMIKLYDETVTRMLVDINDCCTPFEVDTCVLGDDQSGDSSFIFLG